MSSGDNDSSDDDEDSAAPKQWSLIARPPKVLGVDPATQLQVVVRVGPYGGYVQLGEASKKQKPRRTTLPKVGCYSTNCVSDHSDVIFLP
jgi:topoisomerase IA-like protein